MGIGRRRIQFRDAGFIRSITFYPSEIILNFKWTISPSSGFIPLRQLVQLLLFVVYFKYCKYAEFYLISPINLNL